MNNEEFMPEMKNIITKLKKVQKEQKLSYDDILRLMERNGDHLAKSTISNVFSDKSKLDSFSYEGTIRPIAKALLGMETFEENEDNSIQAMKAILKYKIEVIEEMERTIEQKDLIIAENKVKYHEKLEKIMEDHQKQVDFINNQVVLKDQRIDNLFKTNNDLMNTNKELLDHILHCPYKSNCKGE